MDRQRIDHQRGEIAFRKKLYLQQIEGKKIFADEFDARGIERILRGRMQKTMEQMSGLRKQEIVLSPYVEIGAERCQRALAMENDLGANGAALDISFEMLKSCTYYQGVFHKAQTPMRICGDANSLPFMSNSVPFVFCYETLHHFPKPAPVTEEIHRVLSPGHFFFDEEPYKKIVHMDLYKGPKIYSPENRDRSRTRKIVDRFFMKRSCNEIEHGIIENESMSIESWKRALKIFGDKRVKLRGARFTSDLFGPHLSLKYLFVYLLGGSISGTCRKSGNGKNSKLPIGELLICPSCREVGKEALLEGKGSFFGCSVCLKKYPLIDGVLFLFSHGKLKELYPEAFGRVSA